MKAIFFFIISFFSIVVYSQTWEQGYIIDLRNDTIKGIIKSTKFNFWEKVLYKENENSLSKAYFANEIKSYFYKEQLYESIHLPQEVTGIEGNTLGIKQISGEVELYDTKFRYFACACEPEGAIGEGYILIKQNKILVVTKKSLNNRIKNVEDLSDFLSDNEELSYKILNNEFNYKDVPDLILKYNEQF